MSKQSDLTISFGFMLFFTLLLTNSANATTFTVGDTAGWDFGVKNWPTGKTFKAGDVLVFTYPVGVHNVVVVNKSGYDSCNAAGGQVHSSGNDKITLGKGTTYFICGVAGHCDAGQKIAITTT